QHRQLHHVGSVELALEAAVQLQPGQQAQPGLITLQDLPLGFGTAPVQGVQQTGQRSGRFRHQRTPIPRRRTRRNTPPTKYPPSNPHPPEKPPAAQMGNNRRAENCGSADGPPRAHPPQRKGTTGDRGGKPPSSTHSRSPCRRRNQTIANHAKATAGSPASANR